MDGAVCGHIADNVIFLGCKVGDLYVIHKDFVNLIALIGIEVEIFVASFSYVYHTLRRNASVLTAGSNYVVGDNRGIAEIYINTVTGLNVFEGIRTGSLCFLVQNTVDPNLCDLIIITVVVSIGTEGKGNVITDTDVTGIAVIPVVITFDITLSGIGPEIDRIRFSFEGDFNTMAVVGDRRELIISVFICLCIFNTVDQNRVNDTSRIGDDLKPRGSSVIDNKGIIFPGDVV